MSQKGKASSPHLSPDRLPTFSLVCIASALYFHTAVLPTAHSPPGAISAPKSRLELEKLKFEGTMAESSAWESAAETGDRNGKHFFFVPRF